MSAKNPEAFPLNSYQRGMTLRDWFAGQALAGVIIGASGHAPNQMYAEGAYAIADAMLAERAKGGDK